MNQKEAKTVEQVGRKLLELERKEFTVIDDYMEILSQLDDAQLCRECAVMLVEHKSGHIIPDFDIPNAALHGPMILDSVGIILQAFDMAGILMSVRHRYILEMYLALQQAARFAALKKRK